MSTINAKSTKKKDFITIKSASGDDTITMTDGNFKIYAGGGNDNITLSNGYNYVYLQSGDNTVTTGTGNDRIYSGKGSDTFVFNSDIGNDVIYNSTSNDVISFGDNLKDTAFQFYRFGNDLVITDNLDTQTDTITLSKYFKKKSKLNTVQQNGKDIKIDTDVLIFASGHGKIKGTNFNDGLAGSNKKDTIYGYAGDDLIMGGLANDKIYSGSGENTIVVNNGDGHDVLYVDKKATSNTVLFDMGDTVSYSKSGRNLIITADNPEKSTDVQALTVKNYFSKTGADSIASTINLGSVGKTESTDIKTELAKSVITTVGSLKKANKIYGAKDYDNDIIGGNKNDTIYAGDMNNRIDGGKGHDKYYVTTANTDCKTLIFDNAGNDTYNVKSLDTSVFIDDNAGKDSLKVSEDVKYTMFFDVSIDKTVEQYDSLFLVADKNLKNESYKNYVAGGVEIYDFFDNDGKYGSGRIEKISVGGKSADTTLSHFDEIRSNVAAWLNFGSNDFSSAMEALQNGTENQIQELIAVYQGGSVKIS